MSHHVDFSHFDSRQQFTSQGKTYTHYAVKSLTDLGFGPVSRYPFSIRILLENLLRYFHHNMVTGPQLQALASWRPDALPNMGIPFMPSRVILQDFTGVGTGLIPFNFVFTIPTLPSVDVSSGLLCG